MVLKRVLVGMVLVSCIFSTPSAAQELPPTPPAVFAAFTRTASWSTYAAHREENFQLVYSLDYGDARAIDQHFEEWQAESNTVYEVVRRAAEANWQKSHIVRVGNGRQFSPVEQTAETWHAIGVDGRLYVRGNRTAIPAGNTSDLNYPTLTRVPLLAADKTWRQQVDYNTFRVLDDVLELLEAGLLVTQERASNDERFAGKSVIAYQVQLPVAASIVVFGIDIDSPLVDSPVQETIVRDVFYDQWADGSTFLLTVYVDESSGDLLGEDIHLNISVRLDGSMFSEPAEAGEFRWELVFTRQTTYSGINILVTIDEP